MSVRDQDVKDVRSALKLLRQARDLLKMAGARQTVKRVRLAITSCGGALRHAERMRGEEQRIGVCTKGPAVQL